MRLFIGSSSESLKWAKRIAKRLFDAGHEPIGWWDKEKAFRPGDYTLDRLLEINKICDGAIFFFNGGDKRWPRHVPTKVVGKTMQIESIPRDNVILEYGIFADRHGRERVFIVTDAKGSVKLPTDLQGITYVAGRSYFQAIKTRLESLQDSRESWSHSDKLSVISHRPKIISLLGTIPEHWSSRALYLGTQGAKYWQGVESNPGYIQSRNVGTMRDVISKFAQDVSLLDIGNIVSFGPGIASNDLNLISSLGRERVKFYIPIDINYFLLNKAAECIDDSYGNIRVPLAINADFEDDITFIGEVLSENIVGNSLFCMLGGTFGNIEKKEFAFIDGLRRLMRNGDFLLLDTFFCDRNYEFENDPYSKPEEYLAPIRHFFANGVSRFLKKPVEDIAEEFPNLVYTREVTSELNSTKGVQLVITNGDRTLLNIRRYHPDEFESIFSVSEFDVVAKEYFSTNDSGINRGVLLVKRTR